MKLVSFYLPQFHEIPENNDAWGNGFTEWTNVRKAKPLFWRHNQPRIPMHRNYYNLLNKNVLMWQAKLARKAGIMGFCIYHYWFQGRMVLEKPVEIIRGNSDIPINYCFAWANEPWTKTWHGAGGDKEILIPQTYGKEEEWDAHYHYFLKYFKDNRYMKENNCPVVVIYKIKDIPFFNDMIRYWNEKAKLDGFNGIYIISMKTCRENVESSTWINATVDFEPNNTKSAMLCDERKLIFKNRKNLLWNRFAMKHINYDEIYKRMFLTAHKKNQFRTAFIDYDDTPRRGMKGIVTFGGTPAKFGKNLYKIIMCSIKEGNEYVFINAWNEWGEGNYLEPDEKNGLSYLNEIKKVCKRVSEEKND